MVATESLPGSNATAIQQASLMVANSALQYGQLQLTPHEAMQLEQGAAECKHGIPPAGHFKQHMLQSPSTKGREVCRHWARGYCNRGTTCGFPHTGPSPDPSRAMMQYSSMPAPMPSSDEFAPSDQLFMIVKSSAPCKDYASGVCNRGDACKFAHNSTHPLRTRSQYTCRDWMAGVCVRGDACKYQHPTGEFTSSPADGSLQGQMNGWQQMPPPPQHLMHPMAMQQPPYYAGKEDMGMACYTPNHANVIPADGAMHMYSPYAL